MKARSIFLLYTPKWPTDFTKTDSKIQTRHASRCNSAGLLFLTGGEFSEVLPENHETVRLVQAIVQPKVLAEEGLELGGWSVVRDFRRSESFLLAKCSRADGRCGE